MIDIRPATVQDIHPVAKYMRQADVEEVKAATGDKPAAALYEGLRSSSECFVATHNGKHLGMFGVVPDLANWPAEGTQGIRTGFVWYLGTDEIKNCRMEFLRKSSEWVARLGEKYDVVGNYVDARNKAHIRWLKWLGFQFLGPEVSHGPKGHVFLAFSKVV